jgi:hypothetical protein
MPLTVTLNVGLELSLLTKQPGAWKSAGYIVTSAYSVREAINHLRGGDFDLVVLGQSFPVKSRERLTFLIRASGSRIPVVCTADRAGDHRAFADATVGNEPTEQLEGIGELLATRSRMHAAGAAARGNQ